MGRGFEWNCTGCGQHYRAWWGSGFLLNEVRQEEIEKIKNGDYGEPWRALYLSTPYAAFDPADVVFICKDCGRWTVGRDVSLFVPIDPEKVANRRTRDGKTVKELGYDFMADAWTLKEEYRPLRTYVRHCEACGGEMRPTTDENEIYDLPCPYCGGKGSLPGFVNWD